MAMNKDTKKYKDQIRYTETRHKIIQQLGGKCSCGFSDPRALQIDHINGGGHDDRRRFGGRWRIYYEFISENPTLFQVLCANCNAIKRFQDFRHWIGSSGVPKVEVAVNPPGLIDQLFVDDTARMQATVIKALPSPVRENL